MNLSGGPSDCYPVTLKAYDASGVALNSVAAPFSADLSASAPFIFSTWSQCATGAGGFSMQQVAVSISGESAPLWVRYSGSPTTFSTMGGPRVSNPMSNVAKSISGAGYDPITDPNYLDWLSSASVSTQAPGSPVTNLPMRETGVFNAGFLTNSGSLAAPTVATGTAWPTLAFAGSGGAGSGISGDITSPGYYMSGDFTVAVRVKFNSASGSDEGVLQLAGGVCNGTSGADTCDLTKNSNGTLNVFGVTSASPVIINSNFHTLFVVRNGSTLNVYLDTDATPVLTIANLGANQMSAFTRLIVGYSSQDSEATRKWLNGQIGDIILYRADVMAGSQTNIHNYLSSKFP
jgi:hypothetical protein